MANSAQQVANVRGAFASPASSPRACLLVDDVRFSGWTLAMVAGQLRRRGAEAVYPLALARRSEGTAGPEGQAPSRRSPRGRHPRRRAPTAR